MGGGGPFQEGPIGPYQLCEGDLAIFSLRLTHIPKLRFPASPVIYKEDPQ